MFLYIGSYILQISLDLRRRQYNYCIFWWYINLESDNRFIVTCKEKTSQNKVEIIIPAIKNRNFSYYIERKKKLVLCDSEKKKKYILILKVSEFKTFPFQLSTFLTWHHASITKQDISKNTFISAIKIAFIHLSSST